MYRKGDFMVKFKDKLVKNPTHFLALCFLASRQDPNFKKRDDVCVLIFEKGDIALFECAYGFFLVNKNKKLSKEFFETRALAFKQWNTF